MKGCMMKMKSHLKEDKHELKGMLKDDKKLAASMKLGKKGSPKKGK